MFIEGTVTLGSSAADTGVVVQGKVAEATVEPSDGWQVCSVARASDGRFGAASGTSLVCPETNKQHLKIPQDDPDSSAQDGGATGNAVQLSVGRMVNKGSGSVFDGRLGTHSSVTYRAGTNPGGVAVSVAAAEYLTIASYNVAITNLTVVATGIVKNGTGSVISGATVYTDWGDGNGNVSSGTSASNGTFSHTHTFSGGGNQTISSAAILANRVPGKSTSAVSVSAAVPGAPTGLSTTAGNTQVALSWSAPSSDGGASIIDYIIEYSADGGSSWATFSDGTSTTTSATVLSLTNGTTYTFRVKAVNGTGAGSTSGTATATPKSSTTTTTSGGGGGGGGGLGVPPPLTDTSKLLDELTAGDKTAAETATALKDGLAAGGTTAQKIAETFEANLSAGTTKVAEIAEILEGLEIASSATIIETMETVNAASIIEVMDTGKAADIMEVMVAAKAAAIMEKMVTSIAATIMENMTTSVAVTLVETMTVTKASGVMESMATVVAATIMQDVEKTRAGALLTDLAVTKRTGIVERMSEASLTERLPEVTPAALFEIDPKVLFERLPNAPVEQLVLEKLPVADSFLPAPVGVQVTPTVAVYEVADTGEMVWATMVASPKPISKILARFVERATGVSVQIENLDSAPAGSAALPAGSIVSDYLSIDLQNVSEDKVAQGHIKFTVDQSWVAANGIHKWSVFLYRLDDATKQWVAMPTKRVDEDAEFIYYTAPLPGFSTFAIAGAIDIPVAKFSVADLGIVPSPGTSGSPMSITANVTNLTSDAGTYVANLWLDGTVERTQTVVIPADSSARVAFDVKLGAGAYSVRVDRLLGSVAVNPSAATPTAVATPRPTPKPAPVTPTAVPTVKPQPTPAAPAKPTATAVPTVKPQPTPAPAKPTATAGPTAEPAPKATPAPAATAVAAPAEPTPSGGTPIGLILAIIAAVLALVGIGAFIVIRGRRS
jgi:PGF-pre-PGF domain-containing protein